MAALHAIAASKSILHVHALGVHYDEPVSDVYLEVLGNAPRNTAAHDLAIAGNPIATR